MPAKALTIIGKNLLKGLYESVYIITRKRKWHNPITEKLVKVFHLV